MAAHPALSAPRKGAAASDHTVGAIRANTPVAAVTAAGKRMRKRIGARAAILPAHPVQR
jgi:hypothetical protein